MATTRRDAVLACATVGICAFAYYIWPFRYETLSGGLAPMAFDHLTYEVVPMGEHGWEPRSRAAEKMGKSTDPAITDCLVARSAL
jgi:hypothetical protein